jgi:A/G-specific adenine glycosylase
LPAAPRPRPDQLPDQLSDRLLRWYAAHARDLPWRAPDATPWGVLVSEVMLQQTPVARVLPVWVDWLARWPEPADLATAAAGAAIRHWGRLGYPRRALRLHEAAVAISTRHGGHVPSAYADLLALPGIGSYTAAAVASFAFGQRTAVVDTNVRRVEARLVTGRALPAPALSAAETRLAMSLLPAQDRDVARWNVAVMELGALLCTARAPRCAECPVRADCAWQLAGAPPYDGPPRPGQAWAGTDRQLRGRLLAALRATDQPLSEAELRAAGVAGSPPAGEGAGDGWGQVDRCLAGLVADGLVQARPDQRYQLPA